MRHTRRAIRAAHATGHALVAAACGLVGLLRYAAETGRTVRIAYTKEDGTASIRDIRPEQVRRSKAGDLYVRAHDFLRDAARTFRLDRITALEAA
ncbi:WYL domain-containing protein [Streptomyces angustmyceticus]|uniref:WYL domain-containing protein n=1 Tax=Streptomyces angustmyceticus TaxID=285578 RepID=UPI00344C5855